MGYEKNYYSILGLAAPSASTSSRTTPSPAEWREEVRKAYRRALLLHHPDKTGREKTGMRGYSIDDIKKAYLVLSDGGSRRDFDRYLLGPKTRGGGDGSPDSSLGMGMDDSAGHTDTNTKDEEDFILGLEVVDLDDMVEEGGVWYRSCRCGFDRGFVVSEEELEEVEGRGGREVLVGCCGCSLWVRVGFGVLGDGDGDGDEDGDEGKG